MTPLLLCRVVCCLLYRSTAAGYIKISDTTIILHPKGGHSGDFLNFRFWMARYINISDTTITLHPKGGHYGDFLKFRFWAPDARHRANFVAYGGARFYGCSHARGPLVDCLNYLFVGLFVCLFVCLFDTSMNLQKGQMEPQRRSAGPQDPAKGTPIHLHGPPKGTNGFPK